PRRARSRAPHRTARRQPSASLRERRRGERRIAHPNPFTAGEKYSVSTAIAKNLMAEMKLLGMMNAFDRCVHEATRDQIGYTQLLATLLQAEADYRQARKTGNRTKAARFTLRPSFEDLDFTASRSISKAQIMEIDSLNWLKDGRPWLRSGQTGGGQPCRARAAGLHARAGGPSVLSTGVTTWLENRAMSRASGTYLRYRDKLAKPDRSIFDG